MIFVLAEIRRMCHLQPTVKAQQREINILNKLITLNLLQIHFNQK